MNVGGDESLSDASVPLDVTGTGTFNGIPDVDAILLTDSSLQSIGGLPRYFGRDDYNINTINNNTSKKGVPAKRKRPPIYATFPTVKMGQMNLYDHHANVSLDGGNPGYSLSSIDDLFSPDVYQLGNGNGTNSNGAGTGAQQEESLAEQNETKESSLSSSSSSNKAGQGHMNIKPIQTIKYAQTIIVRNPTTNEPAIAITPQRAGHLIGASYFILKRLTDETEVVVAPIYHHAKEKHLDNSTLYKYASACDVLITTCGGPGSALGSLYIPNDMNNSSNINSNSNSNSQMTKSRGKQKIKPILNPPSVTRDESELIETILSTLRRGGNVLLPTDTSGRVLELLYLLNQHWERHRLASAYNLCWVGNMVHNTIEFARSQLEWMAGPLGAQFDSGRGHPFALKSVKMFSNVSQLEAECLMAGEDDLMEGAIGATANSGGNPTCVLASGATLDHGPARDLFMKWSENADNAILLTDSRRCVQRGDVIARRMNMNSMGGTDGMNTDSSEGIIPSPIKHKESLSTMNKSNEISSIPTGKETPNIVAEDEEGAGAINFGSAMTIDLMSDYCTSGQLLLKWCEAKAAREEMADVVECDTMVPKRSPLAGLELKSFLLQEEAKRLKEKEAEERRAMLREVELAKGRLRLNEEETAGGSGKITGTSGPSGSGMKAKDGKSQDTSSRPKKKSRFDANLFLKYSKPCHSEYICL